MLSVVIIEVESNVQHIVSFSLVYYVQYGRCFLSFLFELTKSREQFLFFSSSSSLFLAKEKKILPNKGSRSIARL